MMPTIPRKQTAMRWSNPEAAEWPSVPKLQTTWNCRQPKTSKHIHWQGQTALGVSWQEWKKKVQVHETLGLNTYWQMSSWWCRIYRRRILRNCRRSSKLLLAHSFWASLARATYSRTYTRSTIPSPHGVLFDNRGMDRTKQVGWTKRLT